MHLRRAIIVCNAAALFCLLLAGSSLLYHSTESEPTYRRILDRLLMIGGSVLGILFSLAVPSSTR